MSEKLPIPDTQFIKDHKLASAATAASAIGLFGLIYTGIRRRAASPDKLVDEDLFPVEDPDYPSDL